MSGYEKEHIAILLNSRDRQKGTIEEPTWYLDSAIHFSNDPRKSYRMRFEDIQMPKSYYELNSNYNTFVVIEQGGGTLTITLDQGNYTINELIAELESELDANTTNSNDYTITYDPIQNTISIFFTGTSTQITIDTIANGSTMNQVLGLGSPDTQYITGNDNQIVIPAGAGNVFEGSAIDLNTISYVLIESSITSNNYYDHETQRNIGVQVPMNNDRNSVRLYENHEGHKTKMANLHSLRTISLRLLDEEDRVIDLNGVNWSCKICIYELTETWKK